MKPEDYNQWLSIFQRLLNYYPNENKAQPKFVEERCYLTEEDLVANLKNVFGYDCPYFARLLYLYMSGGFDKIKISFSHFINSFLILKGEDVHHSYNSLAFRIYDIDRDGLLNIMNLLHLMMNLQPTSLVGQEIFK